MKPLYVQDYLKRRMCISLSKSFLPKDEHQHDLKEAYFDLRSESSLVLGVDALLTLQQRRHCIITQTDSRLSEISHTQRMNSISGGFTLKLFLLKDCL